MPGYIGWDPTQDNYFPMSTLELERGKPVGDFQYSSANILVQKTITTYRIDAARFTNFIKKIDFNTSKSCNNYDALLLVSARKIFGYNYYPVSKTVTNYDQAGTSAVAQSESYAYNASNLLTTKTQVNSRGETIVITNKYPSDYTDATSQAMVAAHILSPLIETSESNSGTQVSLVHTNYYSPYTGVYMPQTIQTQTNSNPLDTRSQFYNYDTRGNVWEFSVSNDAHTVFLYGYNSQYIVAKITNTTYALVQQAMTAAGITQAQLDNAATMTDDQLRVLLSGLRSNLSSSQVTTYTYAPVFGMTSITDPKANTIFYEYDTFGRLMNTRDNNNKITKHSDYAIQ
jgi:YD repeat-containing protein